MRVIAVVEMIWIHSFETPDVIAESSSRRVVDPMKFG
jgi:hypothetical protein